MPPLAVRVRTNRGAAGPLRVSCTPGQPGALYLQLCTEGSQQGPGKSGILTHRQEPGNWLCTRLRDFT